MDCKRFEFRCYFDDHYSRYVVRCNVIYTPTPNPYPGTTIDAVCSAYHAMHPSFDSVVNTSVDSIDSAGLYRPWLSPAEWSVCRACIEDEIKKGLPFFWLFKPDQLGNVAGEVYHTTTLAVQAVSTTSQPSPSSGSKDTDLLDLIRN